MHMKRLRTAKLAAGVIAVAFCLTVSGVTPAFAAAPASPVVTTLTQSTTTTPIILSGTADANTSIQVAGGATPVTASSTAGGDWSVSVDLLANVVNHLAVVSFNTGGEYSATTTVDITHDNTAPAAPVITFPTSPYATSTSPITVTGTAEADAIISITGGSSTTTATTTGGGNWSASVGLTASSTNTLSVTAMDAAGNVSAASTVAVTHPSASGTTTTATSSPIITLVGESTMHVFSCNGFAEPGFSAVNSMGMTISATPTGTVDIGNPGTYTITYSATDDQSHTATTTRTVIVLNCSSGHHGSSNRGIERAAAVTPPASSIPGEAVGLNLLQTFLVPPGQVISATPVVLRAGTSFFLNNLGFGMRGQEVVELQTRLRDLGYFKGPVTGYFGPITRNAVRAFQKANGLPSTGFVGVMTRSLFNS